MSEITWVPGGLIGFRGVGSEGKEEIEYQEGAILAFRKGGEEVLFVRVDPESESKYPLIWIPVGEFSPNPVAIATEDDFLGEGEEEEEFGETTPVEGVDIKPRSGGPGAPKRGSIRRRGE